MFMLYQNINTTVSRYIYVLAGMIKEAMENHPFAKFEYSTKKDFYNSKNDEVLAIKNMFEDLTNKMNDIINHLPRETDIKKIN